MSAGGLAVEQHALAGDVDDHAVGVAVGVVAGSLLLALLGERGRVLQGETHDVDVATAGAVGCQGDGGVGLGDGAISAVSALQRLDDAVQVVPSAAAFASSMPT